MTMTKRHKSVFELVLGAILLGAFVALYIIVPGGTASVHSVLIVVTCLPVAMYTLCCGYKKAILMALAGAALSAILLPPITLLSYAIPALLIGLISGIVILNLRKPTAILSMSILHLLQNCFEIYLAYLLMEIRFTDTYTAVIDKAMTLVGTYIQAESITVFLRDFLLCCVPAALLIGAFAKGVLFDMVVDYLMQSKYFDKFCTRTIQTAPTSTRSSKPFTWAYLSVLTVQLVTTLVFLLGIVEYHFVFPAMTAFSAVCAVIYLYYYHTTYIRHADMSQNERMIRTAILLLLFPLTMFATPILDLTKQNKK